MLGKLIKHEFRATGRIMLPFLGALLALSPIAMLCWKLIDTVNRGIFRMFGGMILAIFYAGVVAICVVAFVLMIRRFYLNLLKDEGYLMFTLPVNVHQLIFSKLIVSFVWFVISFIASGLFLLITTYAGSDFSGVFSFVSEISKLVGVGNIVVYTLEGIVCAFLFSSSLCLHFYGAMALGHSFSNHKALLSVCFFVLMSILMSWLTFAAMGLFDGGVFASISHSLDVWTDSVSQQQAYAAIPHFLFAAAGLYFLITSAIYYIPTCLPLKKRLNIG